MTYLPKLVPSAAALGLNIADYGAVNNYTVDSTAAFNAAFAALSVNGGVIYVPDGWNVLVNSPITFSGKSVTLKGLGSSTITIGHSGRAFDIAPGNPYYKTTIEDITFMAGASAATLECIRITYPVLASFPFQQISLINVAISSSTGSSSATSPYPNSFTNGITILNAWLTRVENCQFTGATAQTVLQTGTQCIAIGNSFDSHFVGCHFMGPQEVAIRQTNYCEAITMEDCSIVGINGFLTDSTTFTRTENSFQGLSLYADNCEFDVPTYAIHVDKICFGWIRGSRISIRLDDQAYDLIRLKDSQKFLIYGNAIEANTANPIATGIRITASNNLGNFNRIIGNSFANFATAINFEANTAFNYATNNASLNGANIVNNFVNNGTGCDISWTAVNGAEAHIGGKIWAGSSGQALMYLADVANTANFPYISPSVSGNSIVYGVLGETNASIDITTSGTGKLYTRGNEIINNSTNVGTGLVWDGSHLNVNNLGKTDLIYTSGSNIDTGFNIHNNTSGFGISGISFSCANETQNPKAAIGLTRTALNGIGPIVFYNSNNGANTNAYLATDERMRINSTGSVQIGSTGSDNGNMLSVAGNIASTTLVSAPYVYTNSINAYNVSGTQNINITPLGFAGVSFVTSTGINLGNFSPATNQVNFPVFIGGATGNAVQILAFGTDTNVGITINPKGTGLAYINGNQIVDSSNITSFVGTNTKDYIVATRWDSTVPASQVILGVVLPHAVGLPASLIGTRIVSTVAATASTAFVFSYIRSGSRTTIATFTFAASATSATISGVTIPALAPGDILEVTGGASPDLTLANIYISILAVKQ